MGFHRILEYTLDLISYGQNLKCSQVFVKNNVIILEGFIPFKTIVLFLYRLRHRDDFKKELSSRLEI